ncbi:unnamed protein product, partial [Mesorhabditis spiculigera]
MQTMMDKIQYNLYCTPIGRKYQNRLLKQAAEKYPNGHRQGKTDVYDGLNITIVPYGYDNYGYVVQSAQDDVHCVLIDVGYLPPFKKLLEKNKWKPVAALTTHHHWDHAGGNDELKKLYPEIDMIGGAAEKSRGFTKTANDAEGFEYNGIYIKVHDFKAHTKGHVIYQISHLENDPAAQNFLFTGDSMFVGCIGRAFENSEKEMIKALDRLIEKYSPESFVYPGHEYGIEALAMAVQMDPLNEEVFAAFKQAKNCKRSGDPDIPSTLQKELNTNVFLKTKELTNQGDDDARAMKLVELRKERDVFLKNAHLNMVKAEDSHYLKLKAIEEAQKKTKAPETGGAQKTANTEKADAAEAEAETLEVNGTKMSDE